MADVIGTLIPTKIPSLTDPADIQDAFRLYHYGDSNYNTSNSDPANLVANSIAGQLYAKAPKASPTFTGTVTAPTLLSTTATLTNLAVTSVTTDLVLASGKVFKIDSATVLTSTTVLGRTPGGTISGDLVTIDGSQTLTNKVINNTWNHTCCTWRYSNYSEWTYSIQCYKRCKRCELQLWIYKNNRFS